MRRLWLFVRIVWRRWERQDTFWPQCIYGTLFRYESPYRLTAAKAWEVARIVHP